MKTALTALLLVLFVATFSWFAQDDQAIDPALLPRPAAGQLATGTIETQENSALDSMPFRPTPSIEQGSARSRAASESWLAGLSGVRGTVLGLDEEPVKGTEVRMLSLDTHDAFGSVRDLRGGRLHAGIQARTVRTDAEGEFFFQGIMPGSWHAFLVGVDSEDPTLHLMRSTPVPGEVTDVGILRLDDKATVEGQVLDGSGFPSEFPPV